MTDTSTSTVTERIEHLRHCRRTIDADLITALLSERDALNQQLIAAISHGHESIAQLEAANQRHAAALEAVATARADGYAEGLRDAIDACKKAKSEAKSYQLPQMALGASKCIEDLQALIPASPPADLGKGVEDA